MAPRSVFSVPKGTAADAADYEGEDGPETEDDIDEGKWMRNEFNETSTFKASTKLRECLQTVHWKNARIGVSIRTTCKPRSSSSSEPRRPNRGRQSIWYRMAMVLRQGRRSGLELASQTKGTQWCPDVHVRPESVCEGVRRRAIP